jgi:hypothetical protein
MGLGLPLLQVLTPAQLQAVLVHEFGHFHGGDVSLGPWIYTTRAAIARTVEALRGRGSWLHLPFLWYGQRFLRITHAVSRRQELAADALAAKTVGAGALVDGLRATHRAAVAFTPYWMDEVAPLLRAGYRPPLAEGFARFVAAAPVASALEEALEQHLAHERTDPYDTHPPLRERVAVLEAPGRADREGVAADAPSAVSLIEDVPALEARLMAHLAGDGQAASLQPLDWQDVGERVLLPAWAATARKYAVALSGLTPEALPDTARHLGEWSRRLPAPEIAALPPDERRQAAASILGTALAAALCSRGWVIQALPGQPVALQQGECVVDPWAVVRDLDAGHLDPEAWRARCVTAGITQLDLGAEATHAARGSCA